MPILDVIFFGILGLIVGSFLNVAVLRHNTGRSISGRSGCLSCGAGLKPHMMVPVLSWVMLKGRCAMCGSGISIQYPLVEVATAATFSAIAVAPMGLFEKVLMCAIAALLIAITSYDIKHTIIPDEWAYSFAALAFFIALAANNPHTLAEVVILLGSGPLVAFPMVFLWVVTRGRGIGLGDAKLAVGIGWLLGVFNGLAAVMLAFMIGAAFSVVVLLPMEWYRSILARSLRLLRSSRRLRCGILAPRGSGGFTMKSEVPFGPFLIIATCIIWFITSFYGTDALSAVFLS